MTKEEMRRKVKELSPEQKEFLKKEIERQRLKTKENSQPEIEINKKNTEQD